MEIINTSGRRKTSIARIYMKPGNGTITINKRSFEEYFPNEILRVSVNQPFAVLSSEGQFDVNANISGGGITGQAEALRLAIAKAFVKLNEENKPILRANDLLTRDPRMVERKKPGQKKARKKFQFSKR
jgi:small subunit ribosomal protein S9